MQERTYRIGEAAKLLNLKTYVLRFWETEFPQLTPHRTEKGQRLYSEQDVAMLRTIRHLLHERGLTIEGARKILAEQKDSMLPLGEGDSLPPEAVVPEITQPLYSAALAEAVLSALQRTGQSGYLGPHDDEDEVAPDTQSIEAIVARVIASGEGVPPDFKPSSAVSGSDLVFSDQVGSDQVGADQVDSDLSGSHLPDHDMPDHDGFAPVAANRSASGLQASASQQDDVTPESLPFGGASPAQSGHQSAQLPNYQPEHRPEHRPEHQPDHQLAQPPGHQLSHQLGQQLVQEMQGSLLFYAQQAAAAAMTQGATMTQGAAGQEPVASPPVASEQAAAQQAGLVKEVIEELESLREMLSPRRFR